MTNEHAIKKYSPYQVGQRVYNSTLKKFGTVARIFVTYYFEGDTLGFDYEVDGKISENLSVLYLLDDHLLNMKKQNK